MESSVSIVIPTWNGLDLLRRFLPSVVKAADAYSSQAGTQVEILIVDDGSADATVDWLIEEGFSEKRQGEDLAYAQGPAIHLRYLSNELNRGFGETCNRGFAMAAHRLVFLLNNDVEVDQSAIMPLVKRFDDEKVFAVHCRVFDLESSREVGTGKLGGFARGFIRVHGSYVIDDRIETKSFDSPCYSMFAGGGSAMFDREKFLELGGFEPLLSPFYWEDVELSYRAWKRGYTVLYEARSIARHRISSTISRLGRRRVRVIEQRNRIVFHWINLHDRSLLISHTLWVILLTITAPLRFQPLFIRSVFEALKRMPDIRRRRRMEKSKSLRADREIFELFKTLSHKLGSVKRETETVPEQI